MGTGATPDKKTVIRELIEQGKAKGQLSTKEILDALGELDFEPEQIEKFYDTLEAQGVEIIRRKAPTKLRQTLARIEQLVSEYEVEKIVLGYPKNMNSTEGERCEKTKEFKEMLEKRCGLPVILWDERLTTVAADRSMMETGIRRENRKEYVDEIAAIFILQGYLDYLSNHPEEK